MPIRWYGSINPNDLTYRHFERIVNFCIHSGCFTAIISGLWVVQEISPRAYPLTSLSLGWFLGIIVHLIIVMLIRITNRQQN